MVQQIGHQLFEEDSRGDTDFTAESAGHTLGQRFNQGIIRDGEQSLLDRGTGGIKVPDFATHRQEKVQVEGLQADPEARVDCRARIRGEIRLQSLAQRRELVDALRPIKRLACR